MKLGDVFQGTESVTNTPFCSLIITMTTTRKPLQWHSYQYHNDDDYQGVSGTLLHIPTVIGKIGNVKHPERVVSVKKEYLASAS